MNQNELINQWEEKEKISQQERRYLHFDQKTSINNARKIVTNSAEIGRHYFYPFIKSDIETKKFKKDGKTGERKFTKKPRPVMYASHVDALIYSYYNVLLNSKYESFINNKPYSKSILAYRKLHKSNIDFAGEVFQEIKGMRNCIVLAFDVTKFFDTLDHTILRTSWETILTSTLKENKDHLNVYNSLTRFAYVNKNDLETEFNKNGKKRYRYCSGKEFRERVRKKGLIQTNEGSKGIPQGSPISALLSNIYMVEFDRVAYQKIVIENGGIYRRYSDDILVACKPQHANEIETWILNKIQDDFHLEIQQEKTEKYFLKDIRRNDIYRPISITTGKRKNIQYLGFEFDGDNIFLRPSSLSRFYRRMKYRVHSAVYDAAKNGGKVFKKKLLLKNTEHSRQIANSDYKKLAKVNIHLAEERRFKGNFITYAERAASKLKAPKILKQIRRHRGNLKKAIENKKRIITQSRLNRQ